MGREPPDRPRALTRDAFFAPDWHPDDHPPMPAVVASGRKPGVAACGYCHRADGPGGPENASLAGLPAEYIVRQLADFAGGARQSVVAGRLPMTMMTAAAKALTPDEIAAAAAYFSALRPRANIRVVEADVVPETFVAGWLYADARNGRTEPLGARILEVPEDLEQFENLAGRRSRATVATARTSSGSASSRGSPGGRRRTSFVSSSTSNAARARGPALRRWRRW